MAGDRAIPASRGRMALLANTLTWTDPSLCAHTTRPNQSVPPPSHSSRTPGCSCPSCDTTTWVGNGVAGRRPVVRCARVPCPELTRGRHGW